MIEGGEKAGKMLWRWRVGEGVAGVRVGEEMMKVRVQVKEVREERDGR